MNKQNKTMMLAICVSLAIGAMMPVVAYELGQNESERMTNNVPRVIPFTGQYSKAGQPHTGQVPMSFRLYDSTTSNVALWTGSDRTVDVKDGVFSVVLGDGNDAQTIPNEVFGNAAIYLEIVVQGTALTPRQRLAPAPQAVYAAESARASRLKSTQLPSGVQMSTFGLFCGSVSSTNGSITTGNLTGVQAAKKLCEGASSSTCGASAHMCTAHEMALSHQAGLVGPGSQAPRVMWVYGGAAITTSGGVGTISNRDCFGYTNGNANAPGAGIEEALNGTAFVSENGGFFDNQRCDQLATIACCDSY